jgi:hypothetical protein
MRRKKDGKIAPLILEPDITSKLALPSGSASPPVLWASRRKTGESQLENNLTVTASDVRN